MPVCYLDRTLGRLGLLLLALSLIGSCGLANPGTPSHVDAAATTSSPVRVTDASPPTSHA